MSWNHRIVHNKLDGEDTYEFAEVYYNDKGVPHMYGRPFTHSESVEALREIARRLLKSCEQPVLEHTDIVAVK